MTAIGDMPALEKYKQLVCTICGKPLMDLDWTHVNEQPVCNDCLKQRSKTTQ